MSVTKIGSIEAIALVCIIMANHILLNIPENIISSSGSSAWINVIFVSFLAILFTLLICKLLEKFTGKDILDICEYVGGKWLKFIIGIAYFCLFLMISSTLLQYFSECLKLIYFHTTPIFVITFVFLLGVSIANHSGIKAISNINLIIVPLVLISMLIIFVSTVKYFSFERLFPIFGNGIDVTFISGISNLYAFGGIGILYFLMPLLKNNKNFKKISIISIIISSIYLFLSVITLLLVFTFVTRTNQTLVIYSLSRTIEYGRFFQRTDALFIFLWILLLLSYLSVVLAFCLNIFKKVSNISNPKMMTFCFSLLMFGIGMISHNIDIARFIHGTIYKYYELILVFVISLVILIIANLKIRKRNKREVISS